jgi:diketogulonate reductase-like aldo/keto reductase
MSMLAYNQVSVPSFMYGTAWKKDATTRLVEEAVDSGFRAIDTANQLIHYSEEGVGNALLSLAKKGITREQLFLQTKFTSVEGQDHRTPYDVSADLTTQVKQSFESSLKHLHTDFLDSYVLHGPYSRSGLGPKDWEVWKAIEDHYASKKTRMVGISNVSALQLTQLCEKATTKPMMVQNRCFAAQGWDAEVRKICQANAIIYQGFSLLTANQQVLAHPSLREMGKKYETGIAQLIFRFAMQVGMLPLTGTTNKQHMIDDLTAEEFELTPDEVKHIETLGT